MKGKSARMPELNEKSAAISFLAFQEALRQDIVTDPAEGQGTEEKLEQQEA